MNACKKSGKINNFKQLFLSDLPFNPGKHEEITAKNNRNGRKSG